MTQKVVSTARLAVAAAMLPACIAAAQAQPKAPVPAVGRAPVFGSVSATPATGPMGPPDDAAPQYGPPIPRERHGELAPITWPQAPTLVPTALDEAIVIVTRTYPSAKSGRAAVRAAAADLKAAKWLRFPSFSANIAYYANDHSPQPQLTVDQPIWSGGRIGAGIRRARASETATSADYVDTVQSLALTTTNAYFEVVRLTEREQLLTESVKQHQRLVDQMQRRVTQEVSARADLDLARSRTAQVEEDLTVTRAQRLTALRAMAQLIADPAYDLGPLPLYDPRIDVPEADGIEDQTATFSPLLRRLGAQVDVARSEVDSARASILPQVSAQYSYDDFYKHRVVAVLRTSGNGGLSQLSQLTAARLRVDAAEEDQRTAEQELRRDVASDLIEFQAAKVRVTIAHEASVTAANVSESYMRQFIAGRRSWLDVMNALREAVDASIGETEAQVTAMAAGVRLTIKSGRWRPSFDRAAQQ